MERFELDICSVNAPGCLITLRRHRLDHSWSQVSLSTYNSCRCVLCEANQAVALTLRLLHRGTQHMIIAFPPLISMPASRLSWCQCVIYYSCELQYILYICSSVYVPVTRSFTASTSSAKWRQLFCRLEATTACFSSPSGAWQNTAELISSCLLPFVCPRRCIHAAWRVWSHEQGRSSGGRRGSWQGGLRERGGATDAAWGEETGACRCCSGPLTKQRLTGCQDNHSTLRNGYRIHDAVKCTSTNVILAW